VTIAALEPDPQLLIGGVFETAYSLFSDRPPATQPYEMYVSGEGASFGNSESITRVVETFLTDLQYIVIDGQGPREMVFTVWVTADDDRLLGRAEADLMAVLYKPTLLWWRPPRPEAPWAVFEVANSALKVGEIGENDFEEANRWRKYTITLTCGAWVRSAVEEVATMGAGGDVEETFNSGSESGVELSWYDDSDGPDRMVMTMDDSSGDLVVTMVRNTLESFYAATIDFTDLAIDPSETPLLVVEGNYTIWTPDPAEVRTVRVSRPGGGSVTIPLVTQVPTADGWQRYYKLPTTPPGAIWTTVTFDYEWGLGFGANPFGATATFARIYGIDAGASIGSLRQKMFAIDVKGSVVARGSIEVANEDPLGSAFVYSFIDPDGLYMPTLGPAYSPTFSTSTRAVNAFTASGYKHSVANGQTATHLVPLHTLPDGTYDVVIKGRANTIANAHPSIQAKVHCNGAVAVELPPFTPTVLNTATNTYKFQTIGQVSLPLLRTSEGTSAEFVLFVSNYVSGETLEYDDIYLVNIDVGAYTILEGLGSPDNDPDGNNPTLVALGSPTFEWPAQSIMIGERDRPDTMFSPPGSKVRALGRHELEPGQNRVLVVTDAVDSEGAARYYPRGHTNLEW